MLGEHWHTALSLSTLGYIHYVEGDLGEARAFLERAIAIDEEQFQPVKYETAYDAEVLGRIYVELGLLDEAVGPPGPGGSHLPRAGASAGRHRGWLLLARGELERARGYFEETLAQDGDEWFETTVFDCRRGLAEVARARGDVPGAREELARAVETGEALWPRGHPRLHEVRELHESL